MRGKWDVTHAKGSRRGECFECLDAIFYPASDEEVRLMEMFKARGAIRGVVVIPTERGKMHLRVDTVIPERR